MQAIPFQLIDWNSVAPLVSQGEEGYSTVQTVEFDGLRIRIVKYSAGYLADHWCRKGHIVHCLEGSFVTRMEEGEEYTLAVGQSYIVSDEMSSHRSYSPEGVLLLIIDGE